MSALKQAQLGMAAHLRDPDGQPAPAGVEARRIQVYRDLIYNNIEGFVRGGFPVLHSLYEPAQWEELVRRFLDHHRCRSPYFLEISQEFLHYLMQEHRMRDCDPPFMLELAHYEWVELALDVAEDELPPARELADIAISVLRLSPLAWVLSYQFPVHRIGPGFRPDSAGEPTYLAVYRNREDRVNFIALNAATARLLEMHRDNGESSAGELLDTLADELGMARDGLRRFGEEQLREMLQLGVLVAVVD